MMRWFHGTSTAAGLDLGDWIAPGRGNFEPAVWGTSSLEHAAEFAYNTAALIGGAPVIYELQLVRGAMVVDVDEYDESIFTFGADAVIVEEGERGAPEIAILTTGAAHVVGVV